MTLGQLAALIRAWLTAAVGQVVSQMEAFLNVTVGEITWIANALGYPAAPVDFAGIVGQLTTLQSNVDTIETQILALGTAITGLGSPQQTGSPVTLPTVPPAGYGGAGASDVWSYIEPGSSRPTGYWQVVAGNFANMLSGDTFPSFPSANSPGWTVSGDWGYEGQPAPNVSIGPGVDVTTILATDATYRDWVERIYGVGTFNFNADGHAYITQFSSIWVWTMIFGPVDFVLYKAAKFGAPPPALNLPPIWPGLAGVTFGATYALVDGLVIEGPMQGLELSIDSAPPGTGQFPFGALMSYRWIGALAFEDQDGCDEMPQNLGFQQALYLPKSQTYAQRVRFRVKDGVTGSVYPFTIP